MKHNTLRPWLIAGVLATTASMAHAGTYLGLSLGTDPSIDGTEMGGYTSNGDLSKHFMLGARWDDFAVEASFNRYGLRYRDTTDCTGTSLALALKYRLELAERIRLVSDFGVQRTTLDNDPMPDAELYGTGVRFGIGLEYQMRGSELFFDWYEDRTTFDVSPTKELDAKVTMLTVGVLLDL